MRFPHWYWHAGFINASLLALLFSLLSLGIGRSGLLVADKIFAVIYVLQILWTLSLLADSRRSGRVRAGNGVVAVLFLSLSILSDRFLSLLVPSVFFSSDPFETPELWSMILNLFVISFVLGSARLVAFSGSGSRGFQRSSRFAVSIFLTLTLVPVLSSNDLLKEQWYRFLMGIRGEHKPVSDQIVLLAMPSPDRSTHEERKAILELIADARPKMFGIIGPALDLNEVEDLTSSLPVKVIFAYWGQSSTDIGSHIGFPSVERGESYLSVERRLDPTILAMYYTPVSHGRIDFGVKIAMHALSGDRPPDSVRVDQYLIHAGGRAIPLVDGSNALINYHRVYYYAREGIHFDTVPFESWAYGNWGGGPFLAGGPESHFASFEVNVKGREFLEQRRTQEKTELVGKRRAADMEYFRDKIVLVDIPISGDRYLSEGLKYASVIQNILDGDFARESGRGTNTLAAFLLVLALVLAYTRLNSLKAVGLTVIVLFLTTGLFVAIFVQWSYLVQPGLLVCATVGSFLLFFPVATVVERSQLMRERARLDSELRTAREMQVGLLPKEDPVLDGFEVAGICVPANEVGGDFFDYVWLDDKKQKLGIAVADVSGKAMKAAITAVMTSGMIYQEVSNHESPKKILRNVNRPLYLRIDHRMFTAALFAVLDTKAKELRFSNAGQVHPLLKRGQNVTPLEVRGARLPLGVKEDVAYEEMKIKLRRGDVVVFYTDGVPEAMNGNEEFFGFDRFQAVVESVGEMTAKQMVDYLVAQVRIFTSGAPQHDDMTIVAVKVQ